MVKKILLLSLVVRLLASDEFDVLINSIEETTKIATKENINIDYAPGIVSIVYGKELKKLGARNLYDALKLIPNVEIDVDNDGSYQIVIRGIGGVLASGKTKVLINGVAQNSSNTAIFYLNLPIEIIEKIEVLRGPGSILYGGYALNGTINIITKKEQKAIFSSYNKLKNNYILDYGVTFFYNDKDFKIDGVSAYSDTKGLQPYSKDNENNAHNAETDENYKNIISNIKYKNFLVNIAYYKGKRGEFFGADKVLPDNDGKYNHITKNQNIQISYDYKFNNVKVVPKIGYHQYLTDFEFTKFRATNRIKYNHPYNKYLQTTFALDSFYDYDKHSFLLGLEKIKIKEKEGIITIKSGQTTTKHKTEDEKNKRDIQSIYVQDNINLKNLIINLGLRYENYDDKFNKSLDKVTLPKIAGVYINNNHIYKMQYAKAYRPTTFLENKYNPKNIQAETIQTVELQHIYKQEDMKLATTLFYSVIKNMLKQANNPVMLEYENHQNKIISQGIELEFYKNFINNYLLNSNISYTKAYDKTTKEQLSDYANILGNISLAYKPYSRFSTAINFRYIGKKKRVKDDNRNDLKSFKIFDISCRYLPLKFTKKLDITFGIKNITDQKVKSPSIKDGIINDYLIQRRSYFASLVYRF